MSSGQRITWNIFSKTWNAQVLFANVDWTHDLDEWKSTTKLLFKFHGCSILSNGKLQLTMTLSTMETKYQALMDATKEVIRLWSLLQEFKVDT